MAVRLRPHGSPIARSPSLRAASASAIAAIFVLGTGAARDILIADQIGLSAPLDTFLVVASVPLAGLTVFTGTFHASSVPVLVEPMGERRGPRFITFVLILAVALVTVTALWLVIAPMLSIGAGDPATGQPTLPTGILLLAAILMGSVWTGEGALALARGQSTLVTTSPVFIPIATIAMLLVLPSNPTLALFGGLALGYAGTAGVTAVGIGRSGRAKLTSRLDRGLPKTMLAQAGIIAAGGVAMAITQPIDFVFASSVAEGGAAAVSFALKIPLAIATVGVTVINNVGFPRISIAASADRAHAADITLSWARWSVAAGIAAVAVVWLVGDEIVDLLFGRGRMSARDVALIARLQRIAALTLIPFWISVLCVRLLNSLRYNRPLILIGIGNLVVNIVGDAVLGSIAGLEGIVWATVAMYSGSAIATVAVVRQRLSVISVTPNEGGEGP